MDVPVGPGPGSSGASERSGPAPEQPGRGLADRIQLPVAVEGLGDPLVHRLGVRILHDRHEHEGDVPAVEGSGHIEAAPGCDVAGELRELEGAVARRGRRVRDGRVLVERGARATVQYDPDTAVGLGDELERAEPGVGCRLGGRERR